MTTPTRDDILAIHDLPFLELLYRAQGVHRAHHKPDEIQWSRLLSIKTGACPEDCSYCAQSARFRTAVERKPLMDRDEVMTAARQARDSGATRFCMGAAWRRVNDRDMPDLEQMVRDVAALGLETCMTLGTLKPTQAERLAQAGLDYYNHNLDTSREHYPNIVTTRTYDERLETLSAVRDAGIKVCCGGILGLGESKTDRISLLQELASLPTPPESVPINQLIAIEGTPVATEGASPVEPFDFVRFIATARILLPETELRLSAGRTSMSEELQAWCFMAGANSIFVGDTLLTAANPAEAADAALLRKLGMGVRPRPPA